MKTKFKCFECKQTIIHESDIFTGYGIDRNNNKVCFACCGKQEEKDLLSGKKMCLYLSSENKQNYFISNWPDTLKIACHVRIGNHNFTGKRYDTWFKFKGKNFHGVTYGDNTQICHIKMVK